MAMASVLRRMERNDITVHGFRSTFRDWAAERTNYPNFVVEMALAHVIGDKVEAAYRRGDLYEKRHRLMTDWAKYCGTKPAEVGARAKIVSLQHQQTKRHALVSG
jgi:integrase